MWNKVFTLLSGLAVRQEDRCGLGNDVFFVLSFLDLPYELWQSL